MDTTFVSHLSDSSQDSTAPKLSFWRKIGGGALSIAIIFHAVLLIIGAIWIFQVIREPDKPIDFMPTGGSGGGGERSVQMKVKQRAQITPTTNVRRVFAEGQESNYSIPDPGENFSEMSSLTSLASGGGKLGGFGGHGEGTGFGPGAGVGNGLTGGGNGKYNPFGMVDPTGNALEGTFYDLKQTNKRETTEITNEGVKDVIREFVDKGWREKSLDKYYKAKRTLYQNKIYMPLMKAEGAPAAFECEKEVQPSRWVVVYRGMVTPPRSGRFRFVGAGDDVLVVRFNGKQVFDHGYTSGTTGIHISQHLPFFKGENLKDDGELKKLARRDYPMKLPVNYYQYSTTKNWNSQIGGLAVGAEFEAVAGRSYPIEILISEIPGGLFCASLLIEEIGTTYEKASTGAPVLPLFRLDSGLPQVDPKADNAPPFEPGGPIWKRVSGTAATNI